MNPETTVLMSVYNSEEFLKEAIDSILNQTYRDFEFLIINDGSNDSSEDILLSYGDCRIRLISNERNIGLAKSLNKGLKLAKGKYIARIDSDDIALPERLKKQVSFLNAHPEVGIVGTACILIDNHNRVLGINRFPINDLQIRWVSLLTNPFAHPTVVIRRDSLIKNGLSYLESFHASQDYDLWVRLLKFTRGANLNEPLIRYRVHDNNITNRFRETQLKNHDETAFRSIKDQLPDFHVTPEQVSHLRRMIFAGNSPISAPDKNRIELAGLYLDLFNAFKIHHLGEAGLRELQRHEAVIVAYHILYSQMQPGWGNIVRRLMAMDPGLPLSCLFYLLNAVCRELKRRYL
jgi:glycosyltransferase involved in cell wall biosynthesis